MGGTPMAMETPISRETNRFLHIPWYPTVPKKTTGSPSGLHRLPEYKAVDNNDTGIFSQVSIHYRIVCYIYIYTYVIYNPIVDRHLRIQSIILYAMRMYVYMYIYIIRLYMIASTNLQILGFVKSENGLQPPKNCHVHGQSGDLLKLGLW